MRQQPTEAEDGDGDEPQHFTEVGKGGKVQIYTSESVYKTLALVNEARGKKVSIVYWASLQDLNDKLCRIPTGPNK